MAAAAESAEGFFASKAGRALIFAAAFIACLLAAGMLGITLFGRPHAPGITLDLSETAEHKAAPPHASPSHSVAEDDAAPWR